MYFVCLYYWVLCMCVLVGNVYVCTTVYCLCLCVLLCIVCVCVYYCVLPVSVCTTGYLSMGRLYDGLLARGHKDFLSQSSLDVAPQGVQVQVEVLDGFIDVMTVFSSSPALQPSLLLLHLWPLLLLLLLRW